MASGVTNRGKFKMLGWSFRGTAAEANMFVALLTSATAPTADTNLMSDHTEIAAGTGYTSGGISLTPNATDWDVYTEDDTNDRALIQIKDVVWTATGGNLPTSGNGARWAVLTDDNVTVGSREIYSWFDLVSDRTVSDTQTLTIQNMEIRLT